MKPFLRTEKPLFPADSADQFLSSQFGSISLPARRVLPLISLNFKPHMTGFTESYPHSIFILEIAHVAHARAVIYG